MSVLFGSHAAQNERELRGYRWFWSDIVGPPPSPPVIGRIVTQQEQPNHPAPRFWVGVQGPDVRAPGADLLLIRQEQPGHPASRLGASLQGPNVRQPISDLLIVRQEQPAHPAPRLATGVQGPNVRSPVNDLLAIRQEQPSHPPPRLVAGIQGPNIRPPVADSIITRQEQPREGLAVTWSASPTTPPAPPYLYAGLGVFTRQQQPAPRSSPIIRLGTAQTPSGVLAGSVFVPPGTPGQPTSFLRSGVPPSAPAPTVAPPFGVIVQGPQERPPQRFITAKLAVAQAIQTIEPARRDLITRQETPTHPLPALRGSLITQPAPGAPGPPQGWAIIRPQEPPQRSVTIKLANAPIAASTQPIADGRVFTRQEQPPQRQSSIKLGITQTAAPPTFIDPETRSLITRQEQPSHPSSTLRAGVPPIFVPPFEARSYSLPSEAPPPQPLPILRAGVFAQPSASPTEGRSYSLPKEELPRTNNYNILISGVAPQVLRLPPITRTLITRQEQPSHPLPRVSIGVPPQRVIMLAGTRSAITRQEQPGHPGPRLWPGLPPVPPPPVPPVTRIATTRREQPPHPGSQAFAGVPPSPAPPPPLRPSGQSGAIGFRKHPWWFWET